MGFKTGDRKKIGARKESVQTIAQNIDTSSGRKERGGFGGQSTPKSVC